MKQSRRIFLKNSGIAVLSTPAIISTLGSCKPTGKTAETTESTASIEKFGLQLWTVKEDMAKDPKGTLKAIADFGYKQIESFTSDKGIFWGMKAAEFKTLIADLGLEMPSSHVSADFTSKKGLESEFKKLVDDCALIGVKSVFNPFPGELKNIEEWKIVTEGLNRQGEITKAAGIRMGYHNHHAEFLPTSDGSLPEEVMLKGTDPNLVDFELDLYWIILAGQDPETWLKKYKNRFTFVHVKDLYKEEKLKQIQATEKTEDAFWPLGASTVLGNGRIDFSRLLKIAKENGVTNFVVEQERFDNSTPLKDIKTDAEYMKSLKLI